MALFSKLAFLYGSALAINTGSFAISYLLKTEKYFDLTGSLTFIGLTLFSLKSQNFTDIPPRSLVNSGMVILWAARLGTFLFTRIMNDGEDKRFRQIKKSAAQFFGVFFIQSIWNFITAIPVLTLNSKLSESDTTSAPINGLDYVGWGLWALGFALQVTADVQKRRFRATSNKPKDFITTGVWSWCQHPNYFGEIAMWTGLFLSSCNDLEGLENLTVLSPVFVYLLLTKVSGVPLLRKAAEKKFGKDPVFREYVNTTNVLLPNPFKKPVNLKP